MDLPPYLYDALQRFVHTDYNIQKKEFLRAYAPFNGQPVLELGCGTGTLSTFFPDHTYTGIDLDPARIQVARQRYPKAEFMVADATRLSPDFLCRFSFLFCHAWIHHISDEGCSRFLACIASAAVGREVPMLVLEPVLPCLWINPAGYILAKLDSGRYVRPMRTMKNLLQPFLHQARPLPGRLRWPVPAGAFELRFSASPKQAS